MASNTQALPKSDDRAEHSVAASEVTGADAAPVAPAPRPAKPDPLGSLKTMSEEEKIALFS